jgi:DNA-binding response OmpR family regulator
MTAILVDDDGDLTEVLRALLAPRYDLRVYSSARPAIDALLDGQVDLVLSDLALPGLTGEEVAGMAATIEPRPRIVLMSGDYARLKRARGLADATLLKPFSVRELISACETGESN